MEHLVELFGVGLKVGEGVGRGGRGAGLEGLEERTVCVCGRDAVACVRGMRR